MCLVYVCVMYTNVSHLHCVVFEYFVESVCVPYVRVLTLIVVYEYFVGCVRMCMGA